MALDTPHTHHAAGSAEGPRLRDAVILCVILGLFFVLFLGSRPLSVPDEGRYVEIPREMAVTGDYLTPRLNGVKYFEKPPLFYWFEAILIKHLGLSEWSVRLGPALFGLFGCLAVYYAGARLYGRRAGLFSAIVLSTSVLYYAMGRVITLDMPVSVLLTAALLSFLIATREPIGMTRRLFFWGFYAFSALAVLTKGLIGIVIPGMIIVPWIVLMNEWRILRSMHLLSGMVIFMFIAAPWHILVQRVNPEFFDFYFIHEHFQRYLTKIHGRYKPAWYFIPIMLVGLFPWTAFLVQAVKHRLPASWKDRSTATETIFLLLWAGLVFLFFSVSSSKLMPYILPVLPPLALIIGSYLADAADQGKVPGAGTGFAVALVLAALLATALFVLPRFRPEMDVPGLRSYLAASAVVLLAAAQAAWFLWRRRGLRYALIALSVGMALFLVMSNGIIPFVDSRTVKALALDLKPRLLPGDEVAAYKTYYQDLPVYLERRVTVVDWTGELTFGTSVEDTTGWMITETQFWKRWEGTSRVYVMTTNATYNELRKTSGRELFVIAQGKNNVILSNSEAKP